MLTIRQLCDLPLLADSALLAGASGLDREILWAAVVDIPQADDWVRADELLLTTFFGLRDNVEGQVRLVRQLIEKRVAGMIVATGAYVMNIPDEVRCLADTSGFPIIEMPWRIPFEDIVRVISEHSLNDQYQLYKQSLAIHRALTRLVLEGGSLQDVAHELCALLRRPVEIDDLSFAVLAEATGPGASIDESRRSAINEGRSSPRLLDYLRRAGTLSQARSTLSVQRIDVNEETRALGMTMARILMPIVVARRVYGYVWIIAGERDLEPLDFHAVEHAATVAALILFRNQTAHQAEERMEQHVLSRLLAEDLRPDSALREQLARFHLRLEALHIVVVIDIGGADLRTVELTARNAARHDNLPCVVGERSGRVVALLECARREQVEHFCEFLLESLGLFDTPVRMGVSTLQEAPGGLYREYERALEALALLPALGDGRQVARFEELGLLHWLHALPPQMFAENAFSGRLARLAEHDRTHDGQLTQTLEMFLECEGNGVRAAERLYIHRHTLKYRLRRIEEICDVDLGDSLTKLNLRAALLLRRVRASYGAE
ncbi:MAG TPA: PucR family transcriptional regulator ligand-binding domain-containing protein [Ktedonobacterales bacterium]|jgi:purine catabolism regulator|nr:PucR family transcriptional regulator ligand-binding domain-containing protein [Ktedonobacterales bacterium]